MFNNISSIAQEKLNAHCQSIETLLNKTYDQFYTKHLKTKLTTISLTYIQDTRQVYRILSICEDEIAFFLETMGIGFLGQTIKVLSRFQMLLVSFLLRCFTEPTSDIQQIEYRPKKFDMQVLSNHDYPQPVAEKLAELKERKVEQEQIRNLNLMVAQCLNEREKINALGSSGAPEAIFQTIQHMDRWARIGMSQQLDLQGDDYLKYFDGSEMILELTEKMKRSIKMRRTENTERLIGRMLENYKSAVKQKLDSMNQSKVNQGCQTDQSEGLSENKLALIEAQLAKERLQTQKLKQKISEMEKEHQGREKQIRTYRQQTILDECLFKQYQVELEHKIALIEQLTKQLQQREVTTAKQQPEIDMKTISERFLEGNRHRTRSEHNIKKSDSSVFKQTSNRANLSHSLPKVPETINKTEIKDLSQSREKIQSKVLYSQSQGGGNRQYLYSVKRRQQNQHL